jgi:hypothetical protein
MPFDELKRRALAALEPQRQAFHSAVATAVDEIQVLLDAQRPRKNGKGERVAAELGAFATGRIDMERFASVFGDQQSLPPDSVNGIEEALDTLTRLLAEGDDLYTVRLPAGGDLRTAVRDALARAGAAFGAGRAVENLRTGATPAPYVEGFSPDRWNRAERAIAPPLVVELDGADLRPAGLADYLEGQQRIVLLVRQPAPPAALARLIVPGVLVAQGPSGDVLDGLEAWDGPAIVAIVPEAVAAYGYRPDRSGPGTLTVQALPEGRIRPVGGLSVERQTAELELLRMLDGVGAARVVAAAAPEPATDVDPADKLAAWLLRQATIPAPGEEA